MTKDEIKSILDYDLNREKILKLHPENVDVGAIEVFRRIFVEILNFDIMGGAFEGVAKSVSTLGWNKQAEAVEACIIAESGDFRVLYVELRKLTRTAQRYAVSSIIRERWASKGEFIVIFYAQGSDVWHLVCPYVTEGRTILRRYVVGIGEKHRTVSENLANMDATMIAPLFERVQGAFRLKPVTEQFYGDYKKYFSKIKECTRSLGIDIRNSKKYSHLFLNRLMFVYFIQKKGWIGDNKEFVKWFLEAYRDFGKKDRFHEKWLNNLFFEAMNKPPRKKKFSVGFPSEVCEVLNRTPYLNGGLFEKDNVDELGIELPDSLVMEVIESFLENYNFTITEESPFDLDIAVDPAMLGKIYESLIAEEERGKAGIFYTPRIEVDLMCRLALYEYFQQQRTDRTGTLEETFVSQLLGKVGKVIDFLFTPLEEWKPEDASEFRVMKKILDKVKVVDPACGSGAFLVGMLGVLQELYRKMEIKTDYNLKENIINNNLYGVDIKDWAIRMAEFRLWLALVESEDKIPDVEPVLPNFSFKLRVGDSIIQKVGEDFIKLDKIKGELEGEIREDLEKLEALKERHFKGEKNLLKDIRDMQMMILDKYIDKRIYTLEEKAKKQQVTLEGGATTEAKTQIAKLKTQVKELIETKDRLHRAGSKRLFVWDLDFPEVMLEGGFHVVITNPPYVKQVKIINQGLDSEKLKEYSTEQLRKLKTDYTKDLLNYVYEIFGEEISKRSDLYVYFFVKGLELLNPDGTMVFVSSNSWLDVDFGKYLQKILLIEGNIKRILVNWSEKIFEESDITTVITIVKRNRHRLLSGETNFLTFYKPVENLMNTEKMKSVLLSSRGYNQISFLGAQIGLEEFEFMRKITIPAHTLWKLGGGEVEKHNSLLVKKNPNTPYLPEGNYSGCRWGGFFLLAPKVYFRILSKNSDRLVPLRRVVEIERGYTTNANSFFYFSSEEVKKRAIKKQYLRPLVKSPRKLLFRKISSKMLEDWVFLCSRKRELLDSDTKEYIKWGRRKGFHQKTSGTDGRWYDLGEKKANLFWQKAHYTKHGVYYSAVPLHYDQSFYGLAAKEYPLCVWALLNSTFYAFIKMIYCRRTSGRSVVSAVYELENYPIIRPKELSRSDKERLVKAAEKLNKKKIKPIYEEINWKERRDLDRIVFNILGLDKKEQEEMYRNVESMAKQILERDRMR